MTTLQRLGYWLLRPRPTPARDDALAGRVLSLMQRQDAIAALDDKELSERVIAKTWSRLPYGSDQELLLDEMIRRFDRKCGIERDEDGVAR